MDGAASVLVILLAIALAIFLVLGIILMILLIRISRQIKHITDGAERTVAAAQETMTSVRRFTTPAVAARIVMGLVKKQRKGGRNVKRK